MSGGSLQMSGFDVLQRQLAAAADQLADEKAIGAMAVEAAKPAVDAIAAIVGTGSPWEETKLTRADISAQVAKDSPPGVVKIAIGSKRRSWILRLQEFGTRNQPAHPALRPGWDSTASTVKSGIVPGLRALLPSLRSGG